MEGGHFDVFVIGGGINGAVSAAALAGRGARVALVDRGDFASFTSQESSNLVWGGFKYLENYEIPLVRKLCLSRNRLMDAYPTNIREIGFLASLDQTSPHPPWLGALGSFAYWAIGNFKTQRPRMLGSRTIEAEEPLVDTTNVRGGIEYFDAYLEDNDARFVFSFVRRAMDAGAVVANYVEASSARWVGGHGEEGRWIIDLVDLISGETVRCTADTMVNAAGPFVDGLNHGWDNPTDHRIVFSKGIHLVVRRLTENHRVLAFFDDTQRLFYVIPMGGRSLIGTTDTRTGDPLSTVTAADREFLLSQINARLDLDGPLRVDDIIAERSGVRPLVVPRDGNDQEDTDWTALSRKHEIEVNTEQRIVTVFGGKLTDCLNVGEEVAAAIKRLGVSLEPDRHDWYGEPAAATHEEFMRQARLSGVDDLQLATMHEPPSQRLWRRYGHRAFAMLEAIREDPSMAEDVMEGTDYMRVELHLAAHTEMITKLDDFLRRRSKVSQVISQDALRSSADLVEVATVLFGSSADEKLAEYFQLEDYEVKQ